MLTKALIVVITLNAVLSQLLLKRATIEIGSPPSSIAGLGKFIGDAAVSPWVYASVGMQIFGYILWMVLVSREKLGVATASIGAGFYILMALSAWVVYGESLTSLQWAGIVFITMGVVCMSWAAA